MPRSADAVHGLGRVWVPITGGRAPGTKTQCDDKNKWQCSHGAFSSGTVIGWGGTDDTYMDTCGGGLPSGMITVC